MISSCTTEKLISSLNLFFFFFFFSVIPLKAFQALPTAFIQIRSRKLERLQRLSAVLAATWEQVPTKMESTEITPSWLGSDGAETTLNGAGKNDSTEWTPQQNLCV